MDLSTCTGIRVEHWLSLYFYPPSGSVYPFNLREINEAHPQFDVSRIGENYAHHLIRRVHGGVVFAIVGKMRNTCCLQVRDGKSKENREFLGRWIFKEGNCSLASFPEPFPRKSNKQCFCSRRASRRRKEGVSACTRGSRRDEKKLERV